MTIEAKPQTSPSEPKKKAPSAIQTLEAYLEPRKRRMADLLPKFLTPERVIMVALSAASRKPRLLECTPESIFKSLLVASELGLEPDGPLQHAHLVPYRNKGGAYEAQLQIGYRGFIELATTSGSLKDIDAHAVYERDHFLFEYGLNRKLEHRPTLAKDRGEVIAAYALFQLTTGGSQFVVLSRDDIDHIRSKSRAKDDGPWVTDYSEMAVKSALKRGFKTIRIASAVARAIEVDDAAEVGDPVIVSGERIDPPSKPTAKAAVLAAVDSMPEDPPPAPEVQRSIEDELAAAFGAIAAQASVDGVKEMMARGFAQHIRDNDEVKAAANERVRKIQGGA